MSNSPLQQAIPDGSAPDRAVWYVHEHLPTVQLGLAAAAMMETLHPSMAWMGYEHSRALERRDGIPTGQFDTNGMASRTGHSLAFFSRGGAGLHQCGRTSLSHGQLHARHNLRGATGRPRIPGQRPRLELKVERDRDGGRYSGRRVTALQSEAVIFSMACSFSRPKSGAPEFQAVAMPDVQRPAELVTYQLNAARTFDLEARVPEDADPWYRWPARLWLRIREPLADDPNIRACGVVFLSDLCTGLSRAPQIEEVGLLPSVDHAVWLHRGGDPNRWVLIDLNPLATAGGRGMYTGQLYDEQGALLASLAQESLFDASRESIP